MKRTIALLACGLVLTACGNQSDSNQADSGNKQANAGAAGSGQGASGGDNGAQSAQSGDFKNDQTKRSYALGMDIGNSLKQLPIPLDMQTLTQGVRDVVSGNKTRLTQKQLDSIMQGVVSDMQTAKKKQLQEASSQNLQAGQKFLAQNKKKDGVKTLDDGLQYKVVQPGSGPMPDANDSVTVNYTGTLIDGTVFDSSEKRGKPVTFPVNAVIPGWTEALQMMKQGAEYKLFIPPDLAYGNRGAGAKIGPNATLIFDVKLLKIAKKPGDGSSASDSNSGSGSDGASGSSSDQGSGDQ